MSAARRRTRFGAGACALLGALAMSGLALPGSGSSDLTAQTTVTNWVIAGSLTTGSGSSSDLAARKAQVDKALASASDMYEAASAKVQAAVASYTAATTELPGAQSDLANAKGAVIAAEVGVDQANVAVTKAQNAATAASALVAADDAKVTAQRAAISDVVTAVYEGSAFLGVGSLLTDGSPGEVLDRFGAANEIVDNQHRTLDEYVSARMTAKDALNKSNAAAKQARDAQTAAAAALTKSRNMDVAAQKATDAVNTLIGQSKDALAVAQANKTTTLAQEKELQKESDQVTAQLKKQAAADRLAAEEAAKKKAKGGSGSSGSSGSSGGSKSGSGSGSTWSGGRQGYFIMPIHGWKSSNFGYRFDPIYKRWQLHAGVDIAAAGGTPIHAAKAGKVIRAGWDGGYGNYTCVDTGLYTGSGADHNKDIANCYAHQSRILVHVGEHVSLGQTIGLVGETGAATGYHLHFEVRVDGTPVQPLNWLPKCFC